MASIPSEGPRFDVHEQLARIDKMRAETEKNLADVQKLNSDMIKSAAETAKVKIETRLAPYGLIATSLAAGAALFAAGAAFTKLSLG